MKQTALVFLFILSACVKVCGQATPEVTDCGCPKPTASQFLRVCQGLYNPESASTEEFGYKYQEDLWRMSCAVPGKDTREAGEAKVRCMWNKYRSEFKCINFATSIASGKNVMKFALENGFPGFILEGVKRYKLDVNFIDPDDGQTIMDYIVYRIGQMEKAPPVDTPKIAEFQRIYNLLLSKGALHAKDLQKK